MNMKFEYKFKHIKIKNINININMKSKCTDDGRGGDGVVAGLEDLHTGIRSMFPAPLITMTTPMHMTVDSVMTAPHNDQIPSICSRQVHRQSMESIRVG